MRSPTGADVLLFARALLTVPASYRATCAARFLDDVETAARHLAATGHAHAAYGDGSLAARCHLSRPSAEPMADDPDFLTALIVAAEALMWNSRR
jgi:hypothetical protein